jgi:hypothetical protein
MRRSGAGRLLAARDPLPRPETVAQLRRVVRAGLTPARGRWLSGALDNAWNIPTESSRSDAGAGAEPRQPVGRFSLTPQNAWSGPIEGRWAALQPGQM